VSGYQEAHRSRSSLAAVEAFDRVGAQAWRVALWIVRDEKLAHDIVVEAFAHPREATRRIPDDASLLYDVRRRAIEAASRPPRSASDRTTALEPDRISSAVAHLEEPQRAVVELAIIGELNATAIARATYVPRKTVIALLADALRRLATTQAQPGEAGDTRRGSSFVRRISVRQSRSPADLE